MNLRAALNLPGLPRDEDEPCFREPWEAQVFALALALHERGCWTWTEWTEALTAEIGKARHDMDDDGSRYYEHWYRALTRMVTIKNIASLADLENREHAWEAAAGTTPHGQPIVLPGR